MILAAEYTNGSKTRPAKLDIVEIVGGLGARGAVKHLK